MWYHRYKLSLTISLHPVHMGLAALRVNHKYKLSLFFLLTVSPHPVFTHIWLHWGVTNYHIYTFTNDETSSLRQKGGSLRQKGWSLRGNGWNKGEKNHLDLHQVRGHPNMDMLTEMKSLDTLAGNIFLGLTDGVSNCLTRIYTQLIARHSLGLHHTQYWAGFNCEWIVCLFWQHKIVHEL